MKTFLIFLVLAFQASAQICFGPGCAGTGSGISSIGVKIDGVDVGSMTALDLLTTTSNNPAFTMVGGIARLSLTGPWADDGATLTAPSGRNVQIGATVLPGTAIATTALTTVNLVAGNNGQQISFSAGTDVTLNITSAVAVKGFTITIIQRGSGSVIPTASGGGITIRQRSSLTKTAGQYAVATLSCDIATDCILAGDLQ